MHTVAALVGQDHNPLEFMVAAEVFGTGPPEGFIGDWYEFMLCAYDPPPVRVQGGFTVDTRYGIADLARADTIIAAGGDSGRQPPEELLAALRVAASRGARLVSFCTGAFTLAAAGLLDGREATTHWQRSAKLAAMYPAVKVNPRVLYVDTGQVLTAAGSASSLDLALYVVRLDHGAEVANACARELVVPPHRDGGQAQFIDLPMPQAGPDPFGDALAWATARLAEPLSVDALAERALMSPRTFARQFRATVGTTPHRWLVRQRVLHAQRLLETTDASVEAVAQLCGLGSAATLRTHFQRAVGTTPLTYRRTFRHAGTAA